MNWHTISTGINARTLWERDDSYTCVLETEDTEGHRQLLLPPSHLGQPLRDPWTLELDASLQAKVERPFWKRERCERGPKRRENLNRPRETGRELAQMLAIRLINTAHGRIGSGLAAPWSYGSATGTFWAWPLQSDLPGSHPRPSSLLGVWHEAQIELLCGSVPSFVKWRWEQNHLTGSRCKFSRIMYWQGLAHSLGSGDMAKFCVVAGAFMMSFMTGAEMLGTGLQNWALWTFPRVLRNPFFCERGNELMALHLSS